MVSDLPVVSLFSGAGLGDLGWRAAGMRHVAMCELEPDRAALARLNFPFTHVFSANVEHVADDLSGHVTRRLQAAPNPELFLVACTAPCQGMSKNGQGTLLNNIRKGQRPQLDPRNRLILPGLRIITRLRPRWVVFENVIEMRHTVIDDGDGRLRPILEVIDRALRSDYAGTAYDVEFADYGIPQRRQRLITVYTRDQSARQRFTAGLPLIPSPSHSRSGSALLKRWVSVDEALAGFPQLDGIDSTRARCEKVPFHRVPVLDPKKYEWIRHTPPCRSAFDNQCVHPACGFQKNAVHGASYGEDGINRAHRTTPLYCEKCGRLLPRPYTEQEGTRRIMSGYTSAYKRMDGSLPAPALTRNLSYPCSDQKLHPRQNRVLSLAEAMTLHTLTDYDYEWGPLEIHKGDRTTQKAIAPDSLIRLVIGESVPPRFFELLGRHLLAMSSAQ